MTSLSMNLYFLASLPFMFDFVYSPLPFKRPFPYKSYVAATLGLFRTLSGQSPSIEDLIFSRLTFGFQRSVLTLCHRRLNLFFGCGRRGTCRGLLGLMAVLFFWRFL